MNNIEVVCVVLLLVAAAVWQACPIAIGSCAACAMVKGSQLTLIYACH